MSGIILKPIGFISSPFKRLEEIPPQSTHAKDKTAIIEIMEEYKEGLKDLDNYSHIIVQFYFHKSKDYDLMTTTPWSKEKKGVFATRSPRRPNPVGVTIVKLKSIDGCKLEIQGVDMLDQTPVLDIKPYVASLNPVIE
ncbi:tRNA (N6-threonylcarbamoyladenosine(37)-N6)-methyltransferase TrmO [Paramaledivibacter caminithermalis]|uniref:tRNA-Thr(GGU) m(6)t(6)A37 methyltransferase TsaA n=1 Tax=Paramaledivibacter caminithermalis (strain DSM 15212 / CIP 107654 / DViRD3) TaxID=1121301 RepID=A0A1M6P415_PARC5|nr:tRNA (N6-threonylcarbamoyladenosine(37)-N6)-methyltransferase TrmO [Paramaledivibacter caminithermalis]SHK02664.1 tRNA-Thr(GGU) m(6)t(6)A37 methyltransferase TsaA [Paramaledivibacter caminithermalis DSM 15212]